MDTDLSTVSSSDLSLSSQNDGENSNVVGLHVLTSEGITDSDGIMGELASEDHNNRVIAIPTLSTDMQTSIIGKEGEIALNSSFIPENAVLMETPRGLMLTVPDGMTGTTYNEDHSPNDPASRPLLSCIPVSFFSTCESSVDGDTSVVYGEQVVKFEQEIDSQLQGDVEIQTQIQVLQDDGEIQTQIQNDSSALHQQSLQDETAVAVSTMNSLSEQEVAASVESTEASPVKRKGGWPKGKKRKKQPLITGPRAPVTGYVLYAIDRRKEIKLNHPEISFPEVTKILGQEWSSMAQEVKEKYLAAAEADKKRYMEELKAFKASESYQETVKKKPLMANRDQENEGEITAPCVDEDDNSTELHCKVCNVYFSNLHNKREHMYGRTHLQAVTVSVEKELLRQQQEEQGFMECNLVVSEETSQDGFSALKMPSATSTADGNSPVSTSSGPVDIHGFMMEFIHKNYEREQEIAILKRSLNKSLQDNLTMCREIQVLQEYQTKLEEEIKSLTSTTAAFIGQNDALKMVPTLFGIINL